MSFQAIQKNQSWVVFKVFDIKAKKEIAFDDLNKVHLFKIFHMRILRLLVRATNISSFMIGLNLIKVNVCIFSFHDSIFTHFLYFVNRGRYIEWWIFNVLKWKIDWWEECCFLYASKFSSYKRNWCVHKKFRCFCKFLPYFL